MRLDRAAVCWAHLKVGRKAFFFRGSTSHDQQFGPARTIPLGEPARLRFPLALDALRSEVERVVPVPSVRQVHYSHEPGFFRLGCQGIPAEQIPLNDLLRLYL